VAALPERLNGVEQASGDQATHGVGTAPEQISTSATESAIGIISAD
jgi:hypothetical protein